MVDRLQLRDQAALIRATSRSGAKAALLLDIPKLEDANLAGAVGSAKSKSKKKAMEADDGRRCSLILTEGDSAKARLDWVLKRKPPMLLQQQCQVQLLLPLFLLQHLLTGTRSCWTLCGRA